MNTVINDLVETGLTEYEAKVYNAMLQRDLLSASDITKIGGVPRGRVYDIINQLIEKGFCVTVPGVVKKFSAVDPETAIKNLIEHQKKQERTMLEIARRLKKRFVNKKVNATPFDYIQVLTSKQSQVKKFHELVENAGEFVFAFTKKPYAANPDKEDLKKISAPFKRIIDKGVIVKTIYEADDETEHFSGWVSYFESIGEKIRISKELPMKMLICDNRVVMLSLRNEDTAGFSLSSMVVEHSDLTTALIKLFGYYWDNSMTVTEYSKLGNSGRLKQSKK
jgi:HTH-type transcriptional regulator, sugar sensing transcriptional regulator